MNQASHYVDLIQWLVGPVESVMAKTATLARKIETEDTGVAILKFRSGALGVIEVTMLTYPRNIEGSITLLGEKGTVKIGGTAVNKVEHWEFADYDPTTTSCVGAIGHESAERLWLTGTRATTGTCSRCCAVMPSPKPMEGRAKIARADPRNLRIGEDGSRRPAPAARREPVIFTGCAS